MTADNWNLFIEEFAKLNDYQLPEELPSWLKDKKLEQYKKMCDDFYIEKVLKEYFD